MLFDALQSYFLDLKKNIIDLKPVRYCKGVLVGKSDTGSGNAAKTTGTSPDDAANRHEVFGQSADENIPIVRCKIDPSATTNQPVGLCER